MLLKENNKGQTIVEYLLVMVALLATAVVLSTFLGKTGFSIINDYQNTIRQSYEY